MKKFTFLFVAIACLTSIAFAQGTGQLTLQKGQKLVVENKVTTSSSQEAMGQTIEINADLNSTTGIEVSDATNGKYNLTNNLSRLEITLSMMGKDMKYDSDKKEDRDNEMGKELNDLINKPSSVNIGSDGKAIKEPESKSKTAGPLSGLTGDPTAAYQAAFLVIPANATAGFSWTDTTSDANSKKSTTYTVREIKDKEAVLDIKGTIHSSMVNEMMGNEVKVTTDGTVTGDAIVDMTTGIVKNHAVTIESKGINEIMGMEIPLTSKVISKTTVTAK